MAVKRVRVEVEVPEGLDEQDIITYLERSLEKLRILARVVSVEPKDTLTGEEERLLKEIKRGVARRAEKRIKSGANG
ncbi:MAG: hypothetical protein GSR86_04125 [Desulfurococcales archaeon]|nr:hypothetical protein [Desulfurococcales archaeon]